MWQDTTKSIGKVRVGSKHVIEFKYVGNIKIDIDYWKQQHIEVSCGCTSAVFDDSTNILRVEYRANPIPEHFELEGRNSYSTKKTVTVYYSTDTEKNLKQELVFTALVSK